MVDDGEESRISQSDMNRETNPNPNASTNTNRMYGSLLNV